jgi:hypothetical protein
MKRAVMTKSVGAMLVATVALAAGVVAGAGQSPQAPSGAKPMHMCPPVC